jgi:hypothetical protein
VKTNLKSKFVFVSANDSGYRACYLGTLISKTEHTVTLKNSRQIITYNGSDRNACLNGWKENMEFCSLVKHHQLFNVNRVIFLSKEDEKNWKNYFKKVEESNKMAKVAEITQCEKNVDIKKELKTDETSIKNKIYDWILNHYTLEVVFIITIFLMILIFITTPK